MVEIDIRSVALFVIVLILYGRNDWILTRAQPIYLLEASNLLFSLLVRSWDRVVTVTDQLEFIVLISPFIVVFAFFWVNESNPIIVFVV